MKPLSQIYIYIVVTLAVALSQKDSDEGRPYEFGFTIDGQQHRHEKKDQLGIVQGEFGFITADGVYHVTVYATDENGNFKILSMRNIRISAPLDGSPATGPISPDAGKYLNKQKQIEPPKADVASQAPPQSTYPTSQSSQTLQVVTQRPGSYVFTTQSTIKPACGGCGYITTQKPLADQPFQFQNPAFKESAPPVVSSGQGYGVTSSNVGSSINQEVSKSSTIVGTDVHNGGVSKHQQVTNLSPPGHQQYESDGNLGVTSSSIGSSINQEISKSSTIVGTDVHNGGVSEHQQVTNLSPPGLQQYERDGNLPSIQQYFQNIPGGVSAPGIELQPPGTKYQSSGEFSGQPQFNPDTEQYHQYPQNIPVKINQPGGNIGFNSDFGFGSNPLLPIPDQSEKLPPVSVTGNIIHVGGSKPVNIPIQDKYPGMVDGLPNGIEEKDIKDILYKFHYTVGFHGHYEKGLKNGAKIGGYFVNGRDGISRVVTYVADENGYRPKFKFINLGLDSPDTPKEDSEKQFGLKSFEFVWYPIE